MPVKISHYSIGWNTNEELTLIPVLAHYDDIHDAKPSKLETAYEAASERKCTLYLVDPNDFRGDPRFHSLKIDDKGNGYLSLHTGCWIVDHLVISDSNFSISSIMYYLRTKNI